MKFSVPDGRPSNRNNKRNPNLRGSPQEFRTDRSAGAPLDKIPTEETRSGHSLRLFAGVLLIAVAAHYFWPGGEGRLTVTGNGTAARPAENDRATPFAKEPAADEAQATEEHSSSETPRVEKSALKIVEKPVAALGTTELILEPGENGNFYVDGSINQQPVRFMVDTGASWIAIPERMKTALRLTRGAYVQVSTASGIVGNYETRIEDLTVGPLKFRNIQGALNPYAPNDTVLLGMSALKDVELIQRHGRMILRQQNQTEEQVQAQHIQSEQSAAPVVLRRSLQECMGPDKRVDQATLNCLEGR